MTQTKKRASRRSKAAKKNSKAKIAAIPVLLLILGYVLYDGLAGDAETQQESAQMPASTHPHSVSNQPAAAKMMAWNEPALSELLLNNPFHDYTQVGSKQTPTSLQAANAGPDSQSLVSRENLAEDVPFNVPYIFESSSRQKAIVDGRLVNVGEEVSDGISLQTIQRGQMVLHRSGAPGSDQADETGDEALH
jgi:hypothetical protein